MPKISIIVPVYKSEKYITRCIDSILAQTFTDFELILVDDGSPDNSGAICDEYASKDSRIKVIHQANSGAAAARNTGIKESIGEYLMFCDSDDYVSPMWLERLVSLADEESLVVCSSCQNSELLGNTKALIIEGNKKYPADNYYLFNQAGVAGFLWNAVYRRDIVISNNIMLREQHSEGDYNEDLIFALRYASKIKYIAYTGYSDYLYDVRNDSLSHSFDKHYFAKYKEKYCLWKSFLAENNCPEEQLKDLSTTMLYHFLVSLQMCIDNKEGYRKFKSVVTCPEMQEIVNIADTSKENPKIIKLIKNKQAIALYGLYLLQNLKRRCKK